MCMDCGRLVTILSEKMIPPASVAYLFASFIFPNTAFLLYIHSYQTTQNDGFPFRYGNKFLKLD